MIKVGIPRALLYYQYFPMVKTFFEALGGEVVLSPSTTKAVVAEGSAKVVADTCLPVKVFCGHVISLIGKCDYVFVPAVRSTEKKAYSCSKFLGLPDLVKAVVPNCPPILDVDIDINEGKKALYLAIYRLGRRFTWNPITVKEASEAAWEAYLAYRDLMCTKRLTPSQAIAEMYDGEEGASHHGSPGETTIALIGHPYMVYDEHVNYRLIHRLETMGAKVLTAEMAHEEELSQRVLKLSGRYYWTCDDDVLGAGGYYLEKGIDGMIGVVPFGCGPDSLMFEALKRLARKGSCPFMCLTIDEHTAEAGLITRLEAFLDMIQRRKRISSCE